MRRMVWDLRIDPTGAGAVFAAQGADDIIPLAMVGPSIWANKTVPSALVTDG